MTLVRMTCQDCERDSYRPAERLEVDPGHTLPLVRAGCWWCQATMEVTVTDGMAITLIEAGARVVGVLTSVEIDEFAREIEGTDLLAAWAED